MKVRVKICGIVAPDDARLAAEAGADAIGLNFVPASPRFLAKRDLQLGIVYAARGLLRVGVFADAPLDEVIEKAEALALEAVQLHGHEPPAWGEKLRAALPAGVQIWKAFRVGGAGDLRAPELAAWPCDAVLLDAKANGALGGTGQRFDWSLLDDFVRTKPLILAGGLTPENAAAAVARVRPDWVDTASGVEMGEPGRKDAAKMRKFVESAHAASVQPG